jgi:hypothetical protein
LSLAHHQQRLEGVIMISAGQLATKYNLMVLPHAVRAVSCGVPEFKPAEYKGLRSGIGKERRSSKHFGCKDKCCALPGFIKAAKS